MEPWLYLPPSPWRNAITELDPGVLRKLEEIRFRVDVPVMLYTDSSWMPPHQLGAPRGA